MFSKINKKRHLNIYKGKIHIHILYKEIIIKRNEKIIYHNIEYIFSNKQ